VTFIFKEAKTPIGDKWFLYYWIFCKRFGAECYQTWRQELLASLIVSVIAYFLTVKYDPMAWKNFKVVLIATAVTLGAFALWHLLRSPWLVHCRMIAQEEFKDHWTFGVLGVCVLAGVLAGAHLLTSYLLDIRSIPVVMKVPAPLVPQIVLQAPGSAKPQWSESPNAQTGPFGPILAVELAQEFAKLPKPCKVKLTVAKDKRAFRDTLAWIMNYGADCPPDESSPPTNADEAAPPPRRAEPGMTIHWDKNFEFGAQIAHFLDAYFKVQTSNRLPVNSPRELIWIDIGPGNPWK
jgi:hypothetical protein